MKLIVFESLYSMDGDIAPVREIVWNWPSDTMRSLISTRFTRLACTARGEEGSPSAKVSWIASASSSHARQRIRLAWRIHCRRRFNRRCGAELCAAIHFHDHLAAHGCRRRVRGDPPPEGMERGRTEHQYIAAVTKHAPRAAGLPILDNASHIVPVMIGDADRCKAASDLPLNRPHPTDQLFDRPDRNRASAHHPDSASQRSACLHSGRCARRRVEGSWAPLHNGADRPATQAAARMCLSQDP